MIRVLHGTSSNHVESIRQNGLEAPAYVTTEMGWMSFFANHAMEEYGGSPMYVGLEVDENLLNYDRDAVTSFTTAWNRERQLITSLMKHTGLPEWYIALDIFCSAYTDDNIPVDKIVIVTQKEQDLKKWVAYPNLGKRLRGAKLEAYRLAQDEHGGCIAND